MLSDLLIRYKPVDVSSIRAGNFLQEQHKIERDKLRRISEGSGWKKIVACPVCNSTDRTTELIKHTIELACCLNCSTRYGSQIPANLADVYKSSSYVSFSKEETEDHYTYRRERFGRERVGILENFCGDLTEKRLLDVGCGNGYFLSAAMEKCKYCYGTESSAKLREFTQHKTGLTVFNKSLDKLPERDFDIITLFDVIEHIPDPIALMHSIDRILKPGGCVLIFTPNFDSFNICVMREYSNHVDPTEHVVLYNLPSLRYLANKFGYEVPYVETQGLDIQSILSMQSYKDDSPSAFLIQWHNELQAMINASQCADYVRIMFKKI